MRIRSSSRLATSESCGKQHWARIPLSSRVRLSSGAAEKTAQTREIDSWSAGSKLPAAAESPAWALCRFYDCKRGPDDGGSSTCSFYFLGNIWRGTDWRQKGLSWRLAKRDYRKANKKYKRQNKIELEKRRAARFINQIRKQLKKKNFKKKKCSDLLYIFFVDVCKIIKVKLKFTLTFRPESYKEHAVMAQLCVRPNAQCMTVAHLPHITCVALFAILR